MKLLSQLTTPRILIGLAFAASAVFLYQQFAQAQALGLLFASRRWTVGLSLLAMAVLGLMIVFALTWSPRWGTLACPLKGGQVRSVLFRLACVIYFPAVVVLLAWLVLGHFGRYFLEVGLRLPVYFLLTVGGAALLQSAFPQRNLLEVFSLSGLIIAAALRAALFYPDVSTYPFTMGWSETSRFYYASLFASERVYAQHLPPPVLHPSRYLLQAIPFLFTTTSLWFHRLWQVLLWIGLPLLTTALLARRLKLHTRWAFWGFTLAAFLFLYLGPVYYHLTLCLIPVLVGFDRRRFWQSLGVVVLASLWAGISRVNWIPAPATLAVLLYLLETRTTGKSFMNYWRPPVIWFLVGSLTGVASQFAYAALSGNELEHFGASFTSDLLWYRLWPNATFPLGILPSILLVSAPLFLWIGLQLRRSGMPLSPLRLMGLLAILLVFFAGGLVVSVKIGGGNNLHNLDAYLFFLLVITAYLGFHRLEREEERGEGLDELPSFSPASISLLGLSLVMPVLYVLSTGTMLEPLNNVRIERSLKSIDEYAQLARQSGGEMLFISERHLLTFGMLDDIPLVPDYERTYLMEMAMAGNQAYFSRFYRELKNQRFAVIVTQPMNLTIKGETEVFGEENDAWVEWVAEPVLCYYVAAETVRGMGLQFLVPRETLRDCPSVDLELP